MKSAIFSLLPLAGLALAQGSCTQRFVTKTETNTLTVTVPAGGNQPSPIPSSVVPEDTTSTSTITIDVTVTVMPSPVPAPPAFPYPNGTFNATVHVPSTLSTITFAFPSSEAEAPSSAAEPAQSSVYSAPAAPSPAAPSSSALAIPTSEAPASASSTAPVTGAATNSGEATFYGGNVAGGMCSFSGYTLPSGIFGTALSDSNWDNADNCGACVSVTGPNGNSIKAMIVDQCPGCGNNHLDLFPDAFAELADPSKGVINVSWDIVPCDISSPIVLKNKEGTSPYWFSMQVMNANEPVSKLEVSTDGGSTWKATERQDYNFFENSSGFGTDSVDVKVTSENGGTIIVKGVSIAAGTTETASSNFS